MESMFQVEIGMCCQNSLQHGACAAEAENQTASTRHRCDQAVHALTVSKCKCTFSALSWLTICRTCLHPTCRGETTYGVRFSDMSMWPIVKVQVELQFTVQSEASSSLDVNCFALRQQRNTVEQCYYAEQGQQK